MRHRFVLSLAVVTLAVGACSSGSRSNPGAAKTPHSTTSPTTTSAAEAPAPGPGAAIANEITGGKGINLASASTGPSVPKGWVESEYAVEGTATRYSSPGPLPTDGHWNLTEIASDPRADTVTHAPYRTRIVVRRPAQAKDFNGTVVVEWLNVSGGLDAAPDYSYAKNEIVRSGTAWVGVSAQSIGIEGGAVAVPIKVATDAGAGKGLRVLDPARYAGLHHPGDAFSYDIFTQVARALRAPKALNPLGSLVPKHMLAIGESQSAFALTTYIDGVQPLTREFDGFLVHSRGGAAAPLGAPGKGIDIAGTISGAPTRLRTDLAAPILVLETETDVLGILNYQPASQPDDARLRVWETAGTAHADRYLIGTIGELIGCPSPINAGPGHFTVASALHALTRWVADGVAPPRAPRLEINGTAYARDEFGNVKGGIRTPLVDVPVDTLSGESGGGSVACLLFGSTKPLTAAQLSARYPSRAKYLAEYRAAADRAIKAGFVLPADRAELLAAADPSRIGT